MLYPHAHVWTRWQKRLVVTSAAVTIAAFSALVYGYERYYRGPDDSFFVGTWGGKIDYNVAEIGATFRFKPDHTSECESEPTGKWHGGGEFLYLRTRVDRAWVSMPYTVQIWHIDSMTSTELRMHDVYLGLHAVLKRVE
ncbi:MAG TPA: hypothetical protein VK474_10520 [Chthoniobacterales bacterium]|nr:hypothetical protein [Chthoniobacterales bacterium]